MIILFGTKPVKTPIKGGLSLRKNCGRCHYLSDFHEHRYRQFFTVFFIPVFPVAKGESLLVCSRCDASFYPQQRDYFEGEHEMGLGGSPSADGRTLITCAFCNGRLRIPVKMGRKLEVTCPHCSERFEVKLEENA